MIIEMFCLCDAATDNAGKLNILGAYDTLFSATYPAKVASLIYAIRLRLSADESGEHRLQINCINYDGKSIVAPFSAVVNADLPSGSDAMAFNVIIVASNVVIPAPGKHRIDLLIDGRTSASLPLLAKTVSPT